MECDLSRSVNALAKARISRAGCAALHTKELEDDAVLCIDSAPSQGIFLPRRGVFCIRDGFTPRLEGALLSPSSHPSVQVGTTKEPDFQKFTLIRKRSSCASSTGLSSRIA